MNKKGFTVVELMTTFVLVAIISTLLIKLVVTLKEVYITGDMKTTLITKQSTMTDKIYKDLQENKLTKIEACGENTTNCVKFVYGSTIKQFVIDKTNKTVTYDNYTIKLGKEGYIGEVSLDKFNSDIGSIINFKVPIYNRLVKGDFGINITYQLDDDISFDNDIAFDVSEKGITVTLDDNMNLVYGLEDTNGTINAVAQADSTAVYTTYNISNGIVTMTNNGTRPNDAYGVTNGRVKLEAGKTYIFNCNTDSTWGGNSSDTVQAVLGLNGLYSTFIDISIYSGDKFEFTPTVSGTYWLRFDINGNGKTHKFWNISIKEKKTHQTKQVTVGEKYGQLPTLERDGYEFLGWNGKNKAIINNLQQGATIKNNIINFDASFVSGNSCSAIQTQKRLNETYIDGSNEIHSGTGYKIRNLNKDNIYNWIYLKINGSKKDAGIYFGNSMENGKNYVLTFNIDSFNSSECKASISNLQLEEGETATAYEPYYVQSNTKVTQNKNHTLIAIWQKKEATFLPGDQFNIIIKQIAGDTEPTTSTANTTIKTIKRYTKTPTDAKLKSAQIISTTDSKDPIYAWFDSGIIYYYTKASHPYMNEYGYYMFKGLTKLTSVDLKTLDTTKTRTMHQMFTNCNSLTNLDLSNFKTPNLTGMGGMFTNCTALKSVDVSSLNTSKVTDMGGLFQNCSSLTTLNLSNFNTGSATNMGHMFTGCSNLNNLNISSYRTPNVLYFDYMFSGCSKLTSIDASNFDMTKAANTENMLQNTTALTTFKTPKVYPSDTSKTITLPATFKDSSNNTYTTLTSTSPTQTTLTKQ